MSKKKKLKFVRPDEAFSRGPLSFARFGKNTVVQSNWPEDAFAKMQQRSVEKYPSIIKKIDQLVAEIAQLVSGLPATQLLHRAWWEMAGNHIKVKSESETGTEEVISIRMIDYVQSVIVSVEPAANQRQEVTEEEWKILTGKVEKLFQTVNLDYQICLSAKSKAENPKLDEHFEEFKFKAQLRLGFHRCCCRSYRLMQKNYDKLAL
jgi:hypothetical protein